MGRRTLITLFAVPAAGVAIEGVRNVADAFAAPTVRAWLDVAYTALKAGVILAFTVFVAKRGPARRRARRPLAFAACATAILAGFALEPPRASTATALLIGRVAFALVSRGWMLA